MARHDHPHPTTPTILATIPITTTSTINTTNTTQLYPEHNPTADHDGDADHNHDDNQNLISAIKMGRLPWIDDDDDDDDNNTNNNYHNHDKCSYSPTTMGEGNDAATIPSTSPSDGQLHTNETDT